MAEAPNLMQRPLIYVVVMLVGLLFHFARVDETYFWEDEVSTIIHTSGISLGEFQKQFPANEIRNISFYHERFGLNNGDHTLRLELTRQARVPQFTPLHYTFLSGWHRLVGDSYRSYRLFSLLAFVLTIPVMFFLSKKMFDSPIAAWMTASLIAVSPLFGTYAIEARYPMLWLLILALQHWIFLVCLDKPTVRWWGAYGAVGIVAMYVSILSGIALLAHTLYVGLRRRDAWLSCGVAQLVVLLAYLPWLLLLLDHAGEISAAMSWHHAAQWGGQTTVWQPVLGQMASVADLFVYLSTDPRLLYSALGIAPVTSSVLVVGTLKVIVALSLIIVCGMALRNVSPRTRWFVLLSLTASVLFFISNDIVRGSFISFIPRYQMTTFVVFAPLVGYAIVHMMRAYSTGYWAVYALLALVSIGTSFSMYGDPCVRKRPDCPGNMAQAQHLSSGGPTLIVTDYTPSIMNFASVLIESKNDQLDVLYSQPPYPNFADEYPLSSYKAVYAMHASEELARAVEENLSGVDSIKFRVMPSAWDWRPPDEQE